MAYATTSWAEELKSLSATDPLNLTQQSSLGARPPVAAGQRDAKDVSRPFLRHDHDSAEDADCCRLRHARIRDQFNDCDDSCAERLEQLDDSRFGNVVFRRKVIVE